MFLATGRAFVPALVFRGLCFSLLLKSCTFLPTQCLAMYSSRKLNHVLLRVISIEQVTTLGSLWQTCSTVDKGHLFELRSLGVGHGWKRNRASLSGIGRNSCGACKDPLLARCRSLGAVSFSYAGALFTSVNLHGHMGMFLLQTFLKDFKFAGFGAGFSGICWLTPCSCLFCLHEIVLPWPCLYWFSNKPCLEAAVLYALILSVLLA